MQLVSSVVMTKLVLRFSPATRLVEVPRTEGTTGGHHHTKSPPKYQDSPTGNMTWYHSTTAVCGPITATIISHTDPPATARHTSLLKQVRNKILSHIMSHMHFHFLSLCFGLYLLHDFLFFLASVLGDPHFITFDGCRYTFNGKGEYILLYSPEYQLTVQGRTEPMKLESGKNGWSVKFLSFFFSLYSNILKMTWFSNLFQNLRVIQWL